MGKTYSQGTGPEVLSVGILALEMRDIAPKIRMQSHKQTQNTPQTSRIRVPRPQSCVTLVYIMGWIILLVVSLGFWALLLMEQAIQRQEFSRMVAGTLVAVAAGGVLAIYFLMSDYIQYLSHDIDWHQLERLQSEALMMAEWTDIWEIRFWIR